MTEYKLVCGLEVHAELKTASKMFCGCVNDPFGAPQPNTYTCPVCLGMPGGIPVANKKAVEWTIKLGLALGCEINLFSKFDRKHYFYPDLAKGYQISQYDLPFCYNGKIDTSHGPVRIRRIHLEEDTGKLIHRQHNGKTVSLVDFNRCGVPLIEIVTEPDIHSAAQAKEYGKKLRELLRYLKIADCDMEQGGMRLEANISMKNGPDLPSYKVEVKNINSFRFLESAIHFEMQRQTMLLLEGQTPAQETRGWNAQTNVTFPQRTKEDAEDYRYFPDPDLPPLRFTSAQVADFKASLPELPDQVTARWQGTWQLEKRYADQLISDQTQTAWLDSVFSEANSYNIQPNQIASLLVNKKVSWQVGEQPSQLLKRIQELTATDDVDQEQLLNAIQQVLENNPDVVARYKAGQDQLINFLLGQTLKNLGKKVDTKKVIDIIRSKTR